MARLLLTIIRTDGRTIPVAHTFLLPMAAAEPVRLALANLLARVAWDGHGAADITLTLAGITDAPAQRLALFDMQDDGRSQLKSRRPGDRAPGAAHRQGTSLYHAGG